MKKEIIISTIILYRSRPEYLMTKIAEKMMKWNEILFSKHMD